MKKQINPTQHGNTNINNAAAAGNVPVLHVFKLGLDVDLNNVVTAIQCDHGTIALAQKFSRAQLITWVTVGELNRTTREMDTRDTKCLVRSAQWT